MNNEYSVELDNLEKDSRVAMKEIIEFLPQLDKLQNTKIPYVNLNADIEENGELINCDTFASIDLLNKISVSEKKLNSILIRANEIQGYENSSKVKELKSNLENFLYTLNNKEDNENFNDKLNKIKAMSFNIKAGQQLFSEEINDQNTLLERLSVKLHELRNKTEKGMNTFNDTIMKTSKTKLYMNIAIQLILMILILILV